MVEQVEELQQIVEQYVPSDEVDTVFIPVERKNVHLVKAVKFTDAEWEKISMLMEWLATTNDPRTSQAFIPDTTFSQLIRFSLNSTFWAMGKVADEMAQAEEQT